MRPSPSGFSQLPIAARAKNALAAGHAKGVSAAARQPLAGVILNARSHRNTKLADDAFDLPNVLVARPDVKQDIVDALTRFAERGIELLVISGGDGTIRDVLTRGAPIFGDDWPAVVILPQGKTNALAFDLGLPRKWTLADALEAAQTGRRVTRQPLVVQPRDSEQRTRYGFIFGAGVFNAAIEAGQVAHRYGAFQSFAVGATAVFGVLQALFGIGESLFRVPAKMRIRRAADGKELPHSGKGERDERLIAGFSALTRFPPGLRPFANLKTASGIRYFVLDAPLRRAVALFPFALFGADFKVLKKLGLHRGTGEAFDFELQENFILDGEGFPPGSYRLSLGPKLQFVVP